MTTYSYKAKNKEGETYEATTDAPDQFALYSQIRKEGGEVIEVRAAHRSQLSFSRLSEMFGAVKEHEKIIFTRNLAP